MYSYLLSYQGKDRRLRHHQVALVLEGDLHRGLAEKEGVVAAAGLHRHVAKVARRLLPWLLATLGVEARHWLAGTGGHDGPTLDRLALHRGGWQVQADLGALLALLDLHEDAVADDDELLVVADHGSNIAVWRAAHKCAAWMQQHEGKPALAENFTAS